MSWPHCGSSPRRGGAELRSAAGRCMLIVAFAIIIYIAGDHPRIARAEPAPSTYATHETYGNAQRADFAPDWTAALDADLDHPDPHWRAEAAYELAHDLVAAQRFDRIERQLLRHRHHDVVREVLRIWLAESVGAPLSADTLDALAASPDDETRALATRLLVARRGPAVLEELALSSKAERDALGALLSSGAAVGPRLAA